MNEFEVMKYKLIKEIMERRDFVIEALYEILVNEDYDYVPDIFENREDFIEFIERWAPNKYTEGENND